MSTVSPTTPHAHPAWHVAWRSAVVVLGDLAVLGAAFFAYAAYQNAFRALFFHGDVAPWLRATETGLVLLAIAGATWWALHRWPTSLGTALWLAVPAAAVLLTIGIWAYPAELLGIGIGAAVVAVVDAGLLIAGRPWEQVLSITWVALLLLITVLTGQEI
ncbi:MAG: hypothetical protein U0R76_05125 [Candidatus Nanopelagicales bacterium]